MHVSHGVHEIGAWGTGISLTILIGAIMYSGFKQFSAHRQRLTIVGIVTVLVVGLSGYWFIARPYYARKDCNKIALKYITQNRFAGDDGYILADDVCLNSKGV